MIAKDANQYAFTFDEGAFQGEQSSSGFTGVAAWNEYVDHFGVVGHTGGDLWLGSYWSDVASGAIPELLRRRSVVTTPLEVPATMGAQIATVATGFSSGSGLDYDDGLGLPAGGGIAIDERGRFHVVGSTIGAGYPVFGALARSWLGGTDAVRSIFDLLPARVGRSDQSGELVHNGVAVPAVPTTPVVMTGATTPSAALTPFGRQIDVPIPTGGLRRMLIDWQGAAPAQTTVPGVPEHFILVDRAPMSMQLAATVIQFGVPTAPTAFLQKTEVWVPFGAQHSLLINPGAASLRIPLELPPALPGTVTFSVQVATADLVPYACAGCTTLAMSPAIVFSY